MIPSKIFFTRGIGHANQKIVSFENALRDAQISQYNLVKVSSILPAHCKEISVLDGIKFLTPGEIVYTVLSQITIETHSPTRKDNVFASIGIAKPKDTALYGYLGEYSGLNKTLEFVKKESCDLAKNLLFSSRINGSTACDSSEITAYTEVKLHSECDYITCLAAAVFIE